MTTSAQVSAEIDLDTRDAALQVLSEMGLTIPDAIRLMLAKTARDNRLPFDVDDIVPGDEYEKMTPNKLTQETIEKAERGEDIFHARDAADLFRQLGI